jgi:hypothetical protein
MGICDSGQRTRIIKLSKKPAKKHVDPLPWPRNAEDDPKTPLGVDVEAKRQDIIKIVHKYHKVNEISMEELLQEVFLAIIHKNCTKSAHDPRKSSFGHYVFMVSNNVCINLVHRKKRYDKERDSIDAPNGDDDHRTMLDSVDVAVPDEDNIFEDKMEELESVMRQKGKWDLARYVRAVRSGANPDVIREALTWGNRKVSNKTIRDIRMQLRDLVPFMREPEII